MSSCRDHHPPDMSGFDRLLAMVNNPKKLAAFKAELLAEARLKNPHLSEEWLESEWEYIEKTFF